MLFEVSRPFSVEKDIFARLFLHKLIHGVLLIEIQAIFAVVVLLFEVSRVFSVGKGFY